MRVIMFQPRFAALVESGEKLQTVRPTPKRLVRVGDKLSLRQWTGKPYRSKQRVLREAIVTQVQTIWFDGCNIRLDGWNIAAGFFPTSPEHEFARADGFRGVVEMAEWFESTHRLPFTGIVIKWGAATT